MLAKTDALFEFVFDEQERAKSRIATSGEKPIRAIVALLAFESPNDIHEDTRDLDRSVNASCQPLPDDRQDRFRAPLSVRLSKVFDSPLRLKIMTELNKRPMSASKFFEKFGGHSISNVAGHIEKLEEYGWLTLAKKETGGGRRGGVEYVYRATAPAVFDNRSWVEVPESVKGLYGWRIFEQLGDAVTVAMNAGTFDARSDRHFTWSPVLFDLEGWAWVIAKTDALFEFLFEEQARAKRRIAKSGEEPIPTTVALAVFESPKEDGPKAP